MNVIAARNDELITIRHLLTNCGSLAAHDRILVLCDPVTRDLAEAFRAEAATIAAEARLIEISGLTRHGEEPPSAAAAAMRDATLVMSLCRFSLAHSRARIEAGKAGARFLSMPDYDWALLQDPCLRVDFRAQAPVVRRMADAFTAGSIIRVTTAAGTDVTLSADGRIGNYCPGFVERPGDLGSPPDIEANVSPVETSAEGHVVIDGSITCGEFGLLDTPMILDVAGGKVVRIANARAENAAVMERIFGPVGSKRRVLAECGVGLNPMARLTGAMLTDEGALGCIHFGFGANHTVGGRNEVDFHLDFVMRAPSLAIDGRTLMRDGVLC
jgi:leucyl aminopeptidase (aminopeptidase T)